MTTATYAIRKVLWGNIVFFSVTAMIGLIGTPLYIYHYGVSGSEVALCLLFFGAAAIERSALQWSSRKAPNR